MLWINWSRFGLEDCRIKLHPENLPLERSYINTMSCTTKVNSNTIELAVHTSCYCLLCVINLAWLSNDCVCCSSICPCDMWINKTLFWTLLMQMNFANVLIQFCRSDRKNYIGMNRCRNWSRSERQNESAGSLRSRMAFAGNRLFPGKIWLISCPEHLGTSSSWSRLSTGIWDWPRN